MKFFCSLSDDNYVERGLCLFDSLSANVDDDFELYYLCLDDESYQRIRSHHSSIKAVHVSEVEGHYASLLNYRNRKPYAEYCWSLASSFSRYLLEVLKKPEVLYIDSDIYFYRDPQIIYDELGSKSVGIIRHRHNTNGSDDGEYNVGIIYFRNDSAGMACLRWWNDAILLEEHLELGTCGDQKYLERFAPLFGDDNVCVLDKTFAHGAPWNFRLYVYDNYPSKGTVIWGDKEQPLVFNHFSRLGINYDTGEFNPTSDNYVVHTLNNHVFRIPTVSKFYLDYVSELMGKRASRQ